MKSTATIYIPIVMMLCMPLTLDKLDIAILQALMRDARASYRQIARTLRTTTPTIAYRVERLKKAGLLKGFIPVLDLESFGRGAAGLIFAKVKGNTAREIIERILAMQQVRGVFLISGESNLLIKVACKDLVGFQRFEEELARIEGLEINNVIMIIRSLRDEPGFPLEEGVVVELKCDYCGGPIRGEPLTFRAGGAYAFLCCRSCLQLYREKYRTRIKKLKQKQTN